MSVLLFGVSHRSAPVSVLEQLATDVTYDARNTREQAARYQSKHELKPGLSALVFGVRASVRF